MKSLIGCLLLVLLQASLAVNAVATDMNSADAEIILAYRTTEKLPFIAQAPDNRGLFEDMFREAAHRAGLRLKIERMPKARILNALINGDVDFYPQFTFDDARNKYTFFAPNGLNVSYSAISRPGIGRLDSAEHFNGLTLLHGVGNPDYLDKLGFGSARTKRFEVAEMDLAKAIMMIQKGRADAYIYEAEPLEYALIKSGVTDVILHRELMSQAEPATLGFSRKSRLIALEPNPFYDGASPVSADNQPERLVAGSPLARLVGALDEMRRDGTIAALYRKYLGQEPQ
ncbi:transporter substrate-binding domain-containing protein [Shewanella sp. JM162201]|uniref:Transporter substrate-binding domain-containing protein n=1 Tax=Shewanella jiangmenensis TaxID=2837387 RepID=A0ABS5V6G2_9GAMM|nr:transporter substrate-binding domain-containing protein [Shewanella jiangmenensis]MBT1445412.1 transporter substrate-binding domain-containing protein [Shewanella jiangmenensis]